MKTLLLQRICSSHAAGTATAEALLGKRELDEEAQDELDGTGLDLLLQVLSIRYVPDDQCRAHFAGRVAF